MSKGYTYENIVKKYYDDLIKNDDMVVRFVKRLISDTCCQIQILIPSIDSYVLFFIHL